MTKPRRHHRQRNTGRQHLRRNKMAKIMQSEVRHTGLIKHNSKTLRNPVRRPRCRQHHHPRRFDDRPVDPGHHHPGMHPDQLAVDGDPSDHNHAELLEGGRQSPPRALTRHGVKRRRLHAASELPIVLPTLCVPMIYLVAHCRLACGRGSKRRLAAPRFARDDRPRRHALIRRPFGVWRAPLNLVLREGTPTSPTCLRRHT